MTTRSKNSIDKLGRCSTTGQVARRCRCIHHDEWVKDNPDFNLINLVKDKSKNLSKSIEKKIRQKNIWKIYLYRMYSSCERPIWL